MRSAAWHSKKMQDRQNWETPNHLLKEGYFSPESG